MKTETVKKKWFYELQERAANRIKERCDDHYCLGQFITKDFVFETYSCYNELGSHLGNISVGMYKVDKGHDSYPGYIRFFAETQNEFTFKFTNR